jgi:hypothetical protein
LVGFVCATAVIKRYNDNVAGFLDTKVPVLGGVYHRIAAYFVPAPAAADAK